MVSWRLGSLFESFAPPTCCAQVYAVLTGNSFEKALEVYFMDPICARKTGAGTSERQQNWQHTHHPKLATHTNRTPCCAEDPSRCHEVVEACGLPRCLEWLLADKVIQGLLLDLHPAIEGFKAPVRVQPISKAMPKSRPPPPRASPYRHVVVCLRMRSTSRTPPPACSPRSPPVDVLVLGPRLQRICRRRSGNSVTGLA